MLASKVDDCIVDTTWWSLIFLLTRHEYLLAIAPNNVEPQSSFYLLDSGGECDANIQSILHTAYLNHYIYWSEYYYIFLTIGGQCIYYITIITDDWHPALSGGARN
jgi:hypothetical protein